MSHKSIKKIISSYHKDAPFGFGDFLRGSLALKELCDCHGIDFTVDFSKHEISKYLSFKKPCEEYSNDDVNVVSLNYKKMQNLVLSESKNETLVICSNSFPLVTGESHDSINSVLYSFDKSIKQKTKSFFKDNIEFSSLIKEESKKRLSDIDLNEHSILHFRIGDQQAFTQDSIVIKRYKNVKTEELEPNILKLNFTNFALNQDKNKKFLFYCNSEKIKNLISEVINDLDIKNFFIISGKSSHTSKFMLDSCYKNPVHNGFFETCLDMYNMTKSNSVYSLTVYDFFSNFTKWICSIYDINHFHSKFKKYK